MARARRASRPGHGAVLGRERLAIGPYEVDLTRKNIKNAWLRVTTPDGPLQLSAPPSMSRGRIEAFVLGRAQWVEARRAALAGRGVQQGARTGHLGADGTVMLWGEPLPLADVYGRAVAAHARRWGRPARVSLGDATDDGARERLAAWALETLLLDAAFPLVEDYQARMGVRCERLRVRDARSRWGSCNVRTHVIMLSLSLAHYPPECLELICVHELCHLRVRGHGPDFHALMDRYLPDNRARAATLRLLSRGV